MDELITLVSFQRASTVSGFEVNFSGKWGANSEVCCKKFPLAEFLEGIANGTFPADTGLCCKRINDKQRNGRDFGEFQFAPRLNDLIARIRTGRNEKLEMLYNYLASPQFAQRIRSMLESFETMRADLDAEKRAMQRIWSKHQSQIERMAGSMTSVVGELQAIAQDQLTQLDDVLVLEAITDGSKM